MSDPNPFHRRRFLWLASLAVFIPLAILLWLQYGWLVKLERTSAVARKAELNNYLEAIGTKIEYAYLQQAEHSLNLPAYLFTEQGKLRKAAYHFVKKGEPRGVKTFFVQSFPRGSGLMFYEPGGALGYEASSAEQWRAVSAALSPWAMHAKKGRIFESVNLVVDETDPEHRVLFNPITDECGKLAGVAGMVVDERYFRERLLPQVLEESLWAFFDRGDIDGLRVTVRDGRGELAWQRGELEQAEYEARRGIPFIFTDWRLELSREATPEQLARTNFALNITLSVVLTGVLIAGLLYAMRVAARAMYLSQMKADFVSNVSHELRTPLSSIRVFGEFLRLGRVESREKIEEYGEYIETESRRLTQLINNILDFSKIESGQKLYRFERADVAEVVEECLKTFEVRLRHVGFKISFRRAARSYRARIDPDAIAQAFCNLLDNAVKYSGDSRDIRVEMRSDNGAIVLAVSDRGIGVSPDEQAKIFERFHRVSTGLVHDVKGSGLGLSIVHHIVQAHGGQVTVESEPGQGSTFSIHLPAEEQPAAATAELPTTEPA